MLAELPQVAHEVSVSLALLLMVAVIAVLR